MFESTIKVEKAVSGPYAGRWLVLSSGARIWDSATEEDAQKVAKKARATLKTRQAAERAEQSTIDSINRGTFKNRTIYSQ